MQRKHLNGKGQIYINSGVTNLGIIGRTDYPAKVFPSNTITVDMFGNSYFRDFEYKMATHAHVFSLNFLPCSLKDSVGLYICAQMKYFTNLFSFSNMCNWTKMKGMIINLPTMDGEISFPYMESVIRELQDERISKLAEYLRESGLENTELSQEEKDAVLRLRRGKVKWQEFMVCGEMGVFNVNNTHSIMQSQIVPNSGDFPYVTASESNNSVSTYVNYDMEQIEKGNSIMIGGKTLVITYQESDYFSNDSHNIACYVKDINGRSKEAQLFLVSALYKSMKHKYSWGDSISGKKIKTDTIHLPITASGKIDWNFMQNLINAESRLAIRGVVKWMNKSSQVKDYEIGRSAGSFAADPPGSYGN